MSEVVPVPSVLRSALQVQRPSLLAYVDRHLPSALRGSVDPIDLVQEVCCEALRRERWFDPGQDPTGRRWLFTIARRQITRLWARQRVVRQRSESSLPAGASADPVVGLLEQLAVYERTPSQSAVAHEVMAAVQRALGRLASAHATVIRLRHVERLPAVEVAGRMGRSPAAVDKLLQRAMAALRDELVRAHHG